jgi:hypothetical protein
MTAYLNFYNSNLCTCSYTKPIKITKSNTKRDEHNTKQIKYRRKLNLILPYLYGGELTASEEGEGKRCYV